MKILTLKPTERCNFKCTFCASTDIADKHTDEIKLEDVASFLDRFPEVEEIHVNGGEPLLMKPPFFWSILQMLDERFMDHVKIKITSNLWGFYKNPDKWALLFNHPQVVITTSFQYGNGRLKGDLTPFSEEEFWKVSDLMLERVGYRPNFVAVITKENEDTAVQTALLAKRMGVEAKINYADSSGPQKTFKGIKIGNLGNGYLMADMYERYIEIYDAGLAEYDDSTMVMTKCLQPEMTACPLDTDCDTKQRVLQPSGYFSCVSFGDDKVYPINFIKEMKGGVERLPAETNFLYMTDYCPACELYKVCNGCKKTVKSYREEGMVSAHCKKMTTLKPRIIEINEIEKKD